jgi:hypothetical protein
VKDSIVSEPTHTRCWPIFNGAEDCRSSCRCLACSAPGRAARIVWSTPPPTPAKDSHGLEGKGIHFGAMRGTTACHDRLYQGVAEATQQLHVSVVHT